MISLDESTDRQRLLEQHAGLRRLLRTLDAKALSVIRGEPRAGTGLQATLETTVQVLTEHMRDEERVFITLLPRRASSGRALATLREEHARQRGELASIRRHAASSDDAISLALAIRGLVEDLLLDMDFEDRRYLTTGALIRDRT